MQSEYMESSMSQQNLKENVSQDFGKMFLLIYFAFLEELLMKTYLFKKTCVALSQTF